MTKFRSELGIALALWVSTEPLFLIHLFIYSPASLGVASPRSLARRKLLCASRAEQQASAMKASMRERRPKRGVTSMMGAMRDRVDDMRQEGRGKKVSVVSNFLQETQHVALRTRRGRCRNLCRKAFLHFPATEKKLPSITRQGASMPRRASWRMTGIWWKGLWNEPDGH